jgi:acyl carrier protein
MSPTPWPGDFESLVRQNLPGLSDGETVTTDMVMADYGLDSLRTVSLLIALEDEYEITFPDELLAANPFATVGSLWTAFTELSPAGRA